MWEFVNIHFRKVLPHINAIKECNYNFDFDLVLSSVCQTVNNLGVQGTEGKVLKSWIE